jgi:hypothetical protein
VSSHSRFYAFRTIANTSGRDPADTPSATECPPLFGVVPIPREMPIQIKGTCLSIGSRPCATDHAYLAPSGWVVDGRP